MVGKGGSLRRFHFHGKRGENISVATSLAMVRAGSEENPPVLTRTGWRSPIVLALSPICCSLSVELPMLTPRRYLALLSALRDDAASGAGGVPAMKLSSGVWPR